MAVIQHILGEFTAIWLKKAGFAYAPLGSRFSGKSGDFGRI